MTSTSLSEMVCADFLGSEDPRISVAERAEDASCLRCGRTLDAHPVPTTRPRDLGLERRLSLIAARAAGHPTAGGLDDFADRRAHPGGVRLSLDALQEAAEELGDARNYLLWGIVPTYMRVLAGESEPTADYERMMRALSHVVAAWHALLGA